MFPRNDSAPARWGITGGIGSGKSYVCRRLAERGFPVFYCDDEAKRLIRTDPELRLRLTEIVGPALYDDAGRLNKAVMAAYLCGGAEQAARVDAEVHPRVAREFLRWAGEQRAPVVVMECALLFEARFDRLVDRRILVAAPRDVRLRRVMARDGVTAAQAEAWMALQMSEDERRRRADFVFVNDGVADIESEIGRMLRV